MRQTTHPSSRLIAEDESLDHHGIAKVGFDGLITRIMFISSMSETDSPANVAFELRFATNAGCGQ